nr:RHS repeat-associated core domain-containing protein [Pectobacterium wasabiae]
MVNRRPFLISKVNLVGRTPTLTYGASVIWRTLKKPIRDFYGQYRDDESSLCYNRFRYYDPNGGCYISPELIGLLG